jgi:hypothetical protein
MDLVLDATRTLLLLNGIGAALGPIIAGAVMQLVGSSALMLFLAITLTLLFLFAVYRHRVGEIIPLEEQDTFRSITRTSPEVVELDPRGDTELQQET